MTSHTQSRTAVFPLLSSGCPSAVVWGVPAVVVDTVKSFAVRPLPHVGKEIFETVKPSLANSNSSPAVVHVLLMAFIKAASLHARPDMVLSRMASSVRRKVSEVSCRLCAAATRCAAGADVVCAIDARFAAFASGKKHSFGIPRRRFTRDKKFSEFAARVISSVCHMKGNLQVNSPSILPETKSKWAKQVGKRANRLSDMMKEG